MIESPGAAAVLAAAPTSLGLFVLLVLLGTACLHLLPEPFVTALLHTLSHSQLQPPVPS